MFKNKFNIAIFDIISFAINKLKLLILERTNESEYLFVPLGIIGFIGYASYYVIWREITPGSYENMLLRLVAMLLCLGLISKKFWPIKMRSYLALYWYFTLCYIFPFFYTFMLLKNNFSTVWIQNSMTGLFFLIILLNWIELILILLLGVLLGTLSYALSTDSINTPSDFIGNIFAYIAPIGIAGMFFYGKEQRQKEKIDAMKSLAASIAHELRTPFAALNLIASSMRKYFSSLIHGYELAKNNNLPVHILTTTQIELLSKIPGTIAKESRSANLFIDLLVRNLNPAINENIDKTISVNYCINEALSRYPFAEEEKALIEWNNSEDFYFKGSDILIIHLLFNLIKNALYYLAKASNKTDKKIYIWLEKTKTYNKLYFKDTGTGIAADILPYIFNHFFSKTDHGSGIGLTYCKMVMESLGGSISCESEINNYTLFVMCFPITKN